MNDKDFVLAADGWTQVTPCGEFPHAGAGVTQVIDREACDRIAAELAANRARRPAGSPSWSRATRVFGRVCGGRTRVCPLCRAGVSA